MKTVEQLMEMTEVEIVEYFETNKFSMLEIFIIWKQIWEIKVHDFYINKAKQELLELRIK